MTQFQSFSSARTYWLGILCLFKLGTVCRGMFEFFSEKGRGPPTSWNGLMHDHSQTTAQKHLTLPHLFN